MIPYDLDNTRKCIYELGFKRSSDGKCYVFLDDINDYCKDNDLIFESIVVCIKSLYGGMHTFNRIFLNKTGAEIVQERIDWNML